MMRLITVALCLGAAACQTTGPERIMTKEVRVPVAVQCTVAVERPNFPDTDNAIRDAADIDVLARIYRAGRLLRLAYQAELEAALSGCGASLRPPDT